MSQWLKDLFQATYGNLTPQQTAEKDRKGECVLSTMSNEGTGLQQLV